MVESRTILTLVAVFLISIIGMASVAAGNREILFSADPAALATAAGDHYARQGGNAQAIAWYGKALEINPMYAPALHNLGVVQHSMGDAKSALNSFRGAVDADPGYAKAHYSLALALYAEKDYAHAIEELEQVTILQPENAHAHFDLGVIHIERFRQKEGKGIIGADDLDDLRQGLAEYRAVVALDLEFPRAESNAAIVESVLNGYAQTG